ncbi:endolytic transglycosylase MltG [Gimibacter soli]|uniref:Endolytic murein transglycosylase n=1 Tax=Gimibacter soli TaxID=3024400 RepID=A0AAE9XMJ9_9PROT|nr:endolytic transglycosylase MltG [Gimibacter soli]WCL52792.1 endolytic transglycosylase MltG [Gimibacter soli]
MFLKLLRLAGFLVLFLVIIGGVLGAALSRVMMLPSANSQNEYVYLAPGQGVLRAAYLSADAARSWQVRNIVLVAGVMGIERQLKAGEYELKPGTRLVDHLMAMRDGDTFKRRVAVPEGLSSAQVISLIKDAFGLELEGLTEPAEGSLQPDTWFYERGDKATALVARMQAAQAVFLKEAWETRAPGLPLRSPEEALVLASIVEKETGVASERPLVAAVFVNRLKKGMRLQSDPTVVYGVNGGQPLGRAIRKSDLAAENPYNTYVINGLPPTPIANPGRDTIRAVLDPAPVDYLYFVADGTGGHAFARTHDQHLKNVAAWRRVSQR